MTGSGVKRILAAAGAITVGAILLLGCGSPAGAEPGRTLVIGHRGAAGLRPENTLAAFTAGCELGVDAIELDVLASADDVLVVHHDFRIKPEIARTPDGAWIPSAAPPAIRRLNLTQLKSYDIGRLQPKTGYAGRFSEQVPVDGERIPTFAEAIALFKRA